MASWELGALPLAMRRHRRLQLLVPAVLAGYLVLAWADWWLPKRVSGEIFPFFSWDLFSSPRASARLYTVRITAVSREDAPAAALLDRTLDQPGQLPVLKNPRFQKTARQLAQAHWDEEPGRRERLARQLGNFLRPLGVARYDLVMLNYHPLRHYRGEEPATVATVARFDLDR